MNEKLMRKILSLIVLMLMVFPLSGCKHKEKDTVDINEENFPDPKVLEEAKEYDFDNSGKLSLSERKIMTDLHLENVEKLDGIEYFPNLDHLSFNYSDCSDYDFSKLPKLENLHFFECKFRKLDLSGNLELDHLTVSYCEIEELKLPSGDELMVLYCDNCGLASLDVTSCPGLRELAVDYNELSELDLSCCPELTTLYCIGNNISKLDISACPELIKAIENSEPVIGPYGDDEDTMACQYFYNEPDDLNIYGVSIHVNADTELIY